MTSEELAAVRGRSQQLTQGINHLEDRISTAVGESPVTALIAAEDIRAAWEAMLLCDRKQVVDRLMTVRILPAGKGKRFTREQVGIPWREGRA
jgi:site-specific DNA recombinase